MSEWCMIISGSPDCFIPEKCKNVDFIIACDNGYSHAIKAGITPDLIVGDFDSYKGTLPRSVETVRSVPEKDDTDTLMALREALKRGYRKIVMTGGLGGRVDHMIANISLTAFAAEKGAVCYIVDENHQIFSVRNSTCRIKRGKWKFISIFSMNEKSSGVTLKGLKYPLENAELRNTFPIGVSNEFSSDIAEITVSDGSLLIVLSDEVTE